MKKILLASLLSASTFAVASTAAAQPCPPGSWLCADLRINTGAQVVVPAPPPPQVVYVPPPPPRIYVAPQPVFVAPQQVLVAPQPVYTMHWIGFGRRQALGLGAHLGGVALPNEGGGHGGDMRGLGNVGASLRFRSHPYFATELSLEYFGGRDYNGDMRGEVPVSVSELFYFNPMHRFQLYGLAGLGGSVATVLYENPSAHGGADSANYGYFGGQLGLGAELQLTPHFSLFADVRGFLRARVDANAPVQPEFTRTLSDGRVETTNTSTGAAFRAGAFLYF